MTIRDWLLANIRNYSSRSDLFNAAQDKLGVTRRAVRRVYAKLCQPRLSNLSPHVIEFQGEILNPETLQGLDRLADYTDYIACSLQRARDANTALRSVQRFVHRRVADVQEILRELTNAKQLNTFYTELKKIEDDKPIGLIQLSDLHLGEIVELPINQYDLEQAAARLRLYCHRATTMLKAFGVDRAVLAMTGDLINSDRRLEEALTNEVPRTKAFLAGYKMLYQFISELASEFKQVDVFSVPGNESRLQPEWAWSDKMMFDNYDTLMHFLLAWQCQNIKNVGFGDRPELLERVLEINSKRICMTHGVKAGRRLATFAEKLQQRYTTNGRMVDYIIFGHKHHVEIHDAWAACGSLVGPNAYAEYGLNVTCHATQNVYLVRKNGIDAFCIDLKDASSVEGYPIDEPTGRQPKIVRASSERDQRSPERST